MKQCAWDYSGNVDLITRDFGDEEEEQGEYENELPHMCGELICVRCFDRYMGVWPAMVPLKELECGKCGKRGFMICTGQVMYE